MRFEHGTDGSVFWSPQRRTTPALGLDRPTSGLGQDIFCFAFGRIPGPSHTMRGGAPKTRTALVDPQTFFDPNAGDVGARRDQDKSESITRKSPFAWRMGQCVA